MVCAARKGARGRFSREALFSFFGIFLSFFFIFVVELPAKHGKISRTCCTVASPSTLYHVYSLRCQVLSTAPFLLLLF
jgi:hypothetical protein